MNFGQNCYYKITCEDTLEILKKKWIFSVWKGKIFYFFFPLKNILLAIKSWTPFWFRCHLSTKPPCWWWIASEKPHMALISIRLTTFLIANGILKEVWPLAKGGANDFWVVQLLKYQLHIHEVLNFLDGILKWQDNLILDILLFFMNYNIAEL